MKPGPGTYSLTLDPQGSALVLHRPDCPTVAAARSAGEPVMTVFDCTGPAPRDLPWCDCLAGTGDKPPPDV